MNVVCDVSHQMVTIDLAPGEVPKATEFILSGVRALPPTVRNPMIDRVWTLTEEARDQGVQALHFEGSEIFLGLEPILEAAHEDMPPISPDTELDTKLVTSLIGQVGYARSQQERFGTVPHVEWRPDSEQQVA